MKTYPSLEDGAYLIVFLWQKVLLNLLKWRIIVERVPLKRGKEKPCAKTNMMKIF